MSQIHLEHAHMRMPSGFDHMEASRVSMHASRCVPVTRMGAHDACATVNFPLATPLRTRGAPLRARC
jgi:hypothetical protein